MDIYSEHTKLNTPIYEQRTYLSETALCVFIFAAPEPETQPGRWPMALYGIYCSYGESTPLYISSSMSFKAAFLILSARLWTLFQSFLLKDSCITWIASLIIVSTLYYFMGLWPSLATLETVLLFSRTINEV